MKNYIRNSLKVLLGYCISLLVFVVFIYVFLSLAKDHTSQLLPFYSLLLFLMAFAVVYSDMKRLAEKEKKPQYDLHPYPLKGLIYGLIGFLPIALLEIISVFLVFGDQFADRIKHLAVNTLMGPLYFIIRAGGETPTGYIIATLVMPIVAMLGYLAGHYGFTLSSYFKKADKNKSATPSFKKSPWNPTNRVSSAPVKKKKKTGGPKTTQ